MAEELKGKINTSSEVTQAAPTGTPATAAPRAKCTKRLVLTNVIGLIVFVFFAAFSVSIVYYRQQSNDAKAELLIKTKEMQNMTSKYQALVNKTNEMGLELDSLKMRNAYLRDEINRKDATIESLKVLIAEKEVTIKDLQTKYENCTRKEEECERVVVMKNNQIEELKDESAEYYNDARMVTSLLNSQLNRNQALEKNIDAVEEKAEKIENMNAKLYLEIQSLKQSLIDVSSRGDLQWASLKAMEAALGFRAKIQKIYESDFTHRDCNATDFRIRVAEKAPNLFIATEASTGLSFGGYTSKGWSLNGKGWMYDASAFTFSATNMTLCKNTNPEKAIYGGLERDNKKYLMTFGEYDLSIGDSCIVMPRNNLVSPNHTYACPDIGRENFYTQYKNPTLSKFAFYQLSFEPLS